MGLNLKAMALYANIVAMPVISKTASGKRGLSMTKEQLKREQSYYTAMALAKMLLRDGTINAVDYTQIDTIMQAKFRPIIAGLYPQKT